MLSLSITFIFMQSKNSPATEGKNVEASSAVCLICGKTAKQTEFPKWQIKRHNQGKTATCKVCADKKKMDVDLPPERVPLTKSTSKRERELENVAKMKRRNSQTFG